MPDETTMQGILSTISRLWQEGGNPGLLVGFLQRVSDGWVVHLVPGCEGEVAAERDSRVALHRSTNGWLVWKGHHLAHDRTVKPSWEDLVVPLFCCLREVLAESAQHMF